MNPHLAFLLSSVYDGAGLHPEHAADLRKSGLTDETIAAHKIRTVPPDMFDRLLGFQVPPPTLSMMLIPYYDLCGLIVPHIRVKVFPPIHDGADGHTVKYLQPRSSSPRLFFPLAALDAVARGDGPLLVVEGEKKALAVAQRGLAAIGIAGIEGWHTRGSRGLLADFDAIPLMGRGVEIVPDSDFRTNRAVAAAVSGFATALAARGARARVVILPDEVPA